MKKFKIKMSWIMLLITISIIFFSPESWYGIGTWNLNKEIGWSSDITNWTFWNRMLTFGSLILFVLGYLIKDLFFDPNTARLLSMLHIIFLVILIFVPLTAVTLRLLLILGSWIVFILNMMKKKS